jgi:NADPH2:quinone reductase
VRDFAIGDRVAWIYAPGSYAERVSIPADALVAIPDGVDDRTAAAVMMQGLTASHFSTDFYPVQPGDTALVHAAAGGLGLLLTQIIRMRGGRVIGRVSSEAKVAAARGRRRARPRGCEGRIRRCRAGADRREGRERRL